MTNSQPTGDPRTGDALRRNLNATIESLKTSTVSAIQTTKWPSDSTNAAESLRKSVESLPLIPETTVDIPQDLRDSIDEYIHVMEDVHTRMKDAASIPGEKRWRSLMRIKSLASKGPGKCTLIFQTCQVDVVHAANSFNLRLHNNSTSNGSGPIGSTSPGSVTSASVSPGTQAAHHAVSPGSAAAAATSKPLRPDALIAVRKAFKGLEIASSSIPVAGNFVGAAAK
ncbi:hypothetical protein FRB90_000079, partial [Tulasnella sp. 427]